MDGILLIDKEKDMTSRDVVNEVCKILNTKKIGHNGTLDPFATGVLVLCVGKCTKLVELITSYDKIYEAEIILGEETDTLDITGNTIKTKETLLKKNDIEKALKDMIKTYYQEVPIYSAIKINGKKLYEYARNNEDIILPKKEVTIKNIELISDIKYIDKKTIFKIRCEVSKGTYIRSLAHDLALKIGTVGMLKNLRRIKQGIFKIEDTYKLEDIKNGNYKLLNKEIIFDNYYTEVVNKDLETKIKNGSLLDNIYKKDYVLFKNKDGLLLALYKIYDKDKTKLKPFKML